MGCSESRKKGEKQKQDYNKDSKKYQFQIYAILKQNDFEQIKEFIPSRFDVKYKMPYFVGKTALHLAAEFCDGRTIAYLLKCGADVNALDDSGCPPIYCAMRNGNLKTVNAILNIGSKVNTDIVTNHNLHFHDFINNGKYKESLALLRKIKYNRLPC
jgi:ankyrin repeat protein